MPEATHRLALPLLTPGQAQKELTHNEALTRVDMLVQPVVQAIAPPSVPGAPVPGQCWIVGENPAGAWLGQDGAIACWTEGGWRFVDATDGMQLWCLGDNMPAVRMAGQWRIGHLCAAAIEIEGQPVVGAQRPAIADPVGGNVIDPEARATILAILGALRGHGLIAT
jgi:hypothetical protein